MDKATTKHTTDKIAMCRRIVAEHQAMEIDGVLVDASSANAIVQVFDNISERNQQKYLDMPIGKMGIVAWEVLSK